MIKWGKNMNNKIFISSIIVVAVLIGVSFTSVVGYKSIDSDLKASPLFNIRSSRAIDEESEDLTSDYLKKGRDIKIHLPTRNNKVILLERFANIIKMMNDKSYDRFVEIIIKHLRMIDDFQENNKDDITIALNQLRDNPNRITPHIMEQAEPKPPTYQCTFTWPECPPTLENTGIIFCLFWFILGIIDRVTWKLKELGLLPTIFWMYIDCS